MARVESRVRARKQRQQTQFSDKAKWLGAYFVTSDLWLILQGFDLLPVQYNLGVRCVPHHFDRWLAGRWEEEKHIIHLKQKPASGHRGSD